MLSSPILPSGVKLKYAWLRCVSLSILKLITGEGSDLYSVPPVDLSASLIVSTGAIPTASFCTQKPWKGAIKPSVKPPATPLQVMYPGKDES